MAKIITATEAAALIPAGAVIMCGGFLGCGSPHRIIEALAQLGTGDLTLICNDGGMSQGPKGGIYGIARLIANHQVKKLIVSHVGTNPQAQKLKEAGELELVLVPQGSLAEMIRAGGAGLGGVLTPTGLGTMVEDMEHVAGRIEVDGRTYLLERPYRADVALISGYNVDKAGNVWYKGSTINFNKIMATAADLVIAEADNLVEPGQILPENVHTPGVFVDYIVDGGREDEARGI